MNLVNFPINKKNGNTKVYLVVYATDTKKYHSINNTNHCYLTFNNNLLSPYDNSSENEFENFLSKNLEAIQYQDYYFPNFNDEFYNPAELESYLSIPLHSCLLLGSTPYSYLTINNTPWVATFNDLNSEGKKLFYQIKNNYPESELRILTFN